MANILKLKDRYWLYAGKQFSYDLGVVGTWNAEKTLKDLENLLTFLP